jgi:hypothetical protein
VRLAGLEPGLDGVPGQLDRGRLSVVAIARRRVRVCVCVLVLALVLVLGGRGQRGEQFCGPLSTSAPAAGAETATPLVAHTHHFAEWYRQRSLHASTAACSCAWSWASSAGDRALMASVVARSWAVLGWL